MVGASPLPAAVRDELRGRTPAIPLVEGYGLTEATCASARSFPDASRPGLGRAAPAVPAGARPSRSPPTATWDDLPAGETGVLAISGPTVFPGYVTGRDDDGHVARRPRQAASTAGWTPATSARVDEDGFVHLTGRAKDLIIRGGHNIDPAIIEDALLAHPQVTAASAVGRPDVHAGEVPVAYVTLAPAPP